MSSDYGMRVNYLRQEHHTVIRGKAAGSTVYDYFPRATATVLGSIQLIGGIALVILGIALAIKSYLGFMNIGEMINAAIMAILTGSFSIAAGQTRTACKISTTLVFGVLTVMGSGVVVVITVRIIRIFPEIESEELMDSSSYKIVYLQLIVAAVESVVGLISSIISCHFVCLCCKDCCCPFDVTKTQQLILAENSNESELGQILVVSSSAGGSVPVETVAAARMANEFRPPPPGYKELADKSY